MIKRNAKATEFKGTFPFDWRLPRQAPFTALKNLSFFGIVCALFERSEFANTQKQIGSCVRVPFSLVLYLIELRMVFYPHL